MRALLWNCRGAGKPSFAPAFRRLVQQHKPEICVLFETRLSGQSLQKARAAIPRSWNFYAVESQGLSGGIIVTWAQGDYQIDVFNVCKQEVILVISEDNRSPWVLAAVYASTDYRVRRRLWAEASQLITQGFEKFWTCYPRSWEIVREAWDVPMRGDAMYRQYRVSRRLELTKRRLRRWNREEVGNIFRRIEESEEAIAGLQAQEALGGSLAEEEMGELRSLLSLHDSLLRQQEIFWRQKSRVQWIQEGDRNTRFFHQSTVIRRHRNRIRVIRDEDGQLVEDPDSIRRVLEGFFRARWSEQMGTGSSGSIIPPVARVAEEDMVALTRPVLDSEIREVMWSLEGDKAPGPDGFPPLFFRRYWMIVGQGVTAAIQQFFSTAVMSTDWQRTLVTLIPKRQDASEPSHFRPISLCTTLYKATAKLLAVRLRIILSRLISPEQGAFVGGRSITDNVLIAQKFMYDLGRASSRRSLMGVKLDMERAYDRMRWDFVQQSLQEFGFPEAWIRWIMGCIRGPSFAILVNGTPSRYFVSSGGLRQGCPLSPLLFIICADALSRTLRYAVTTQELEVYRPVPDASPISHLLFADDCLLLVRATRQAAGIIWTILRDYCSMSGQRVNLSKSAICFSPKTKPDVKTAILEILGVGEQEGTLRYLGVPISGQRLRSSDCTSLEISIRHRLEGWQIHSLSMMGRIILVRSVLSSIPIYLLSNSLIPVATVRNIEQIFRDFIWGRTGGRRGIHLMAWEVVCQPTRYGGLGVQSLVARREVLAARHAARVVLEPDGMWSSLMRAKYGDPVPGARSGRRHSPIWREICARAGLVFPAIRWAIGDGRSIDVLEDRWVTEQPMSRLPITVDTSRLAGLRVSDLMEPEGDHWRMELIREAFGEQLAERILALPIFAQGGADRLVWMPTGRSQVRARDIHTLLSREPARQIEGGWIWRMRIYPRVALFIWKVAWGCLPTRSLLARRGVRITQFCDECTETEETMDHVLLQCPRARGIWSRSPTLLPHSVESTQGLIHWLRVAIRRPSTVEAGIQGAYLAHSIWLDRNAGIFEGRQFPPWMVVDRAMRLAREVSTAAITFSSEVARDTWGTLSAVTAPRMSPMQGGVHIYGARHQTQIGELAGGCIVDDGASHSGTVSIELHPHLLALQYPGSSCSDPEVEEDVL
ncbi:uncharacterized protein LOC120107861 [Phoenix dactylifera]|uniref:Uncharacterized protein LOC120107861 n=1 Tax=Phoenix dactylifera TaxID=42345 RepID=A0A8B8ZSN7_PHODC|nr:uncharacterized protein LOC120107861 [Phoenix dactylifera]